MTKFDKLLNRFLSKPKNFTYKEAERLLNNLGYEEAPAGKTTGSRVAFINYQTKHIVRLHKPHPRLELKKYQLDDIENELRSRGVIQ